MKISKISQTTLATTIGLALAAPSQAVVYTYDQLHRLTQVTYDSGYTIYYRYDSAGNLLSVTTKSVLKFSIEGHVTVPSGEPLATVLIQIDGRTVETDEHGYYQITDLPAGDYTLIASKDRYNFTPLPITVGENQPHIIDIVSDGLTPCLLYAVHDEKRRDTQFFTVNPSQNFEVRLLGQLHLQADIEALDSHPHTNQIFAAAGDDGTYPGHLYQVNAQTGDLFRVGSTGFEEINGLSFQPNGSLWGWAEGDGLIQINTQTGFATLELAYEGAIEDITWDNQGITLYGVEHNQLLAYNSQTTSLTELGCTLPGGEVEALEMLPDGRLLFSIHNDQTVSIHALDINSCQLVGQNIQTQVQEIELNDIEGLAWPLEACSY